MSFSSISQAYRDLILVVNPLATADQGGFIDLNGSSTDFSTVRMLGYSGGAISGTWTTNELATIQTNSSTVIMHFMDYSATDKHKTILQRQNAQANGVAALAHRWASTSAITSIKYYNPSFSFISGATFALYGIAS